MVDISISPSQSATVFVVIHSSIDDLKNHSFFIFLISPIWGSRVQNGRTPLWPIRLWSVSSTWPTLVQTVVCVVCVCVVCGTNDSRHGESVLARADYAPNWVTEHLRASSRRPRHPEPWTTKNSSSSRAEKRALTSMRTECEKCRKMRQKPSRTS